MRTSRMTLMSKMTLLAVLMGFVLVTSPAFAGFEGGACCLSDNSCVLVTVIECAGAAGTFLGEGTTCELVQCDASVAVPVLSISALMATIGALGGLGAYGLIRRRRRQS